MPEVRSFRGREVKNARRMALPSGKVVIRITYVGPKGRPGRQVDVTPEDYDSGVVRTFKPGAAAHSSR